MIHTAALVKQFCVYDFVERDCAKTMSLLTEDICWFGTSDREDVHSKEEARRYLEDEIGKLPTPYAVDFLEESCLPVGGDGGVAFLRARFSHSGISLIIRITATTCIENGTEKINSVHFSVADAQQQPSEYFPVEQHKAKLAQEKEALVMSTMAGGLMGGYCEDGFPFYFINDRMLQYLGYRDEQEFVADIDGLIENVMHPDDRQMVSAATREQMSEGGRYAVDYRMRRKDGSYIWVHDIGKLAADENGRAVILSVCYDITPEHDKQMQMDNLIDALPGGVALFRYVDGDLELLYQSTGVAALTGRTPEEYAELIANGAGESFHPEDAPRVFATIAQAALGDQTGTLDYRIPYKGGGYVWISGSFRRVSSENGCPILHAVFVEMPQLRELMTEITDNSGTSIIVSDNQTHELLYLNKAVTDRFPADRREYSGKRCYEFLNAFSAPCSYCERMLESARAGQPAELYYPQLDRYYLVQGRIAKWAGREARIESLTDITASKKSQKQLDELVNGITCGVVVCSMDLAAWTCRVLYMNKGYCDLFEGKEDDLRLRFESETAYGVSVGEEEKINALYAKLKAGEPHAEITLSCQLLNGKKKWVHLDVNVVPQPDGTVTTYATYSDVTTQVEQEAQLRDVIRNVPGGVCLYRWDGVRLNPLVVSDQFSRLLGENAWESLANTPDIAFRHVHPDDLPALQQAVMEGFRCGKIETVYRSLNASTHQYLWIQLRGTAIPQSDGSQLAYVSYTDITEERLTAQQLRTSERMLEAATEHAGLWYWSFDAATDRAYFSSRCIRDFDFPPVMENFPEAWLEKGRVLPEYCEAYRQAVRNIKNGAGEANFEAQVRMKDGLSHWNEFRFKSLPTESGGPGLAVCTSRIIDTEKNMQRRYELEAQKPSLGERDLLFHATLNLTTGKTLDYVYTVTHNGLSEEYATIELVRNWVAGRIVGSDDREKFLQANEPAFLHEMVQKGETRYSMDYRRRMPDGRILWVRNLWSIVQSPDSGELILFEYCYNIHAQKMAEEVLSLSTAFNYEFLASLYLDVDQIMLHSRSKGAIQNGFSAYSASRREYADTVVAPVDRETFWQNSAPETIIAQLEQATVYSFLTKVLRSDGSSGIHRTQIYAYDRENRSFILTVADVTELLKEEERRNARLSDALEVAQQANRAKSDFLSAMSHDIRTPMNAIVGMCALALEDERDDAQVHESLQTIQSSSQILLELINNILDMSRIESGKMVLHDEPFSLSDQIHKTADSYRVLAQQKNQKFQLYTNIRHDNCKGDVAHIHSAVDNVLSNAIKYTPDGGTITYRVSEQPSTNQDIGQYRFEISDSGIGMSEETKQHIFEPFYRGNPAYSSGVQGTGLGLSITSQIVELKGGTISVESSPGIGTTFVIELPIHFSGEKADAAFREAAGENKTYDFTGIHILLCEDHPVNQKVVIRILEKVHARVTLAINGQEGYEKFAGSAPGTYQLILMDIRMPVMDGHEAAAAIRACDHPQAKGIPIVALSANAFSEDVQKSMQHGMNAHIAKPVAPEQIYEMIASLCADSRTQPIRKQKVLFVDDTELNIAVLTANLQRQYEVFIARDGTEALNTLEQNPDMAAVITDLMMPEMDGVTLIKTIRANDRYNHVAVLANTQYGGAKQEQALREIGADDFLYKPTIPEVVDRRLKEVLKKRAAL